MTYNVFGGTLSLTQLQLQPLKCHQQLLKDMPTIIIFIFIPT